MIRTENVLVISILRLFDIMLTLNSVLDTLFSIAPSVLDDFC